MAKPLPEFGEMSLFSLYGERKYLNEKERGQFLRAVTALKVPIERTFALMLFWTGCRPSEALSMTPMQVHADEYAIAIRSKKKRGRHKDRHFRIVPVPRSFIVSMQLVHGAPPCTRRPPGRLWGFSRTKAWRLIRRVMDIAGIFGIRASARGLRHGFGVHAVAVLCDVPLTLVKKWLGHASLDTTQVYLNVIGPDERAIAQRMWA